jgi:ABC-type glycerol-3-phosphate transport system substrate-binding protein
MVGCDPETWFSPVSIQAYQYFGETYGVPTEGNMVSSVTNIRMDFLEEADAAVQDMWPPNVGDVEFNGFDDMWALAESLQQADPDGTVVRWGLSSRGWDNRHLYGIMRTLGQDWWDPEQRQFHLNSEAAIEAMRMQVVIPVFEREIETELQDNFDTAMLAGKVAVGCGNVCIPGLASKESIRVDSCVYPSAIPGREALFVGEGGWGFVVPAQAKEPEVGIEFLKYMATYAGQKEYCWMYGGEYEGVRFAGNVPAAVAVAEGDADVYPEVNYVGQAFRRVVPAQRRTVYYGSDFGIPGEMEGIASAAISNVRTGQMTAEEALNEAQALLEEMLARWDEDKKVKTGG